MKDLFFKKDPNQISGDENYMVSEMINALEGIHARVAIIDEKMSELEDTAIETILNETKWGKDPKRNEHSISELWDAVRQPNRCVTGISVAEGKKGCLEKYLKK